MIIFIRDPPYLPYSCWIWGAKPRDGVRGPAFDGPRMFTRKIKQERGSEGDNFQKEILPISLTPVGSGVRSRATVYVARR